MEEYRLLTEDEIGILENNGCTAEDWTGINVAADFRPAHIKNVSFHGEVNLGVFEKNIEVTKGFIRHSGLRNATLRNVTVGDNCLIENIGNYINNYIFGEECCICNVCTMETTDEATFGEGNIISVLNEAGNGNVMLFSGLTSNIAALMIKHSHDKELTTAIRTMIKDDIGRRLTETGTAGNGVRIMNTSEITNTHIGDNCEINGACRLSDCTITAGPDDNVYIGSGVICENSIIADGSAILNSAKIENCYVGEACQITNGFTAESSLFFANCHMSNGEACAAFCGPFSSSHHKSTLLIGCMLSFYNAGSATNFSNHAYKMGPVHYGHLERGSKTASGSHLLLPANIGAFSVCLGKITNHPDTRSLPFSYVIADGKDTFIVPGKNITTAGLFRDIRKWPRRDIRIYGSRKSIVNYDWLSPFTINEILQGKKILENLKEISGDNATVYTYGGCKISRNSLSRGIRLYGMAVEMFIGEVLRISTHGHDNRTADNEEWCDLAGLLIPERKETDVLNAIKSGSTDNVDSLAGTLKECNEQYEEYLQAYTYSLIRRHLNKEEITEQDILTLKERGEEARKLWLGEIRKDAEKEYAMGDVERGVLDKFLTQLETE